MHRPNLREDTLIRTKREIAPRAPFPTIEGEHDGAVLEQFREGNWRAIDIGQGEVGCSLAYLHALLGDSCLNQRGNAFGQLGQYLSGKLFRKLVLQCLDLLLKGCVITCRHRKSPVSCLFVTINGTCEKSLCQWLSPQRSLAWARGSTTRFLLLTSLDQHCDSLHALTLRI